MLDALLLFVLMHVALNLPVVLSVFLQGREPYLLEALLPLGVAAHSAWQAFAFGASVASVAETGGPWLLARLSLAFLLLAVVQLLPRRSAGWGLTFFLNVWCAIGSLTMLVVVLTRSSL